MAKTRQELKNLVRIYNTDIPANLTIYAGLTKIKGISWSFSNAVCHLLNIDKRKKISDLNKEEIEKIENFLKNPEVPAWIMNRRKDLETGKDKHLLITDLSLQREFDIRRLKKIKCYRGIRHAQGLPVRGQRTRAHFRHGKTIGVQRSKQKPARKKGKK